MDNYKVGAHKYFLYGAQEYFFDKDCKIENKKMQSIRGLLNDYINLEMNIKLNSSDSRKLLKGKKALLESILFNISNSPLSKDKEFSNDIKSIQKLIKNGINELKSNDDKGKDKANRLLFNCISSFNKRIRNHNILNGYIDIHNAYDTRFKDVEILLDCYVSELLYEGYSLSYLKEWYKSNFSNDVINNAKQEIELESLIEKFKELSKNSDKQHDIIISINLPESFKKQLIKDGNKRIKNIEYNYIEEFVIPNDKRFKVTAKSIYLKSTIIACDEIKAIEIMTSTIENYIEVYKALDTSIGTMPITGCYTNRVIDLRDAKEYTKDINYRELEDIQEFIELREKYSNKANKGVAINDIERVINIVQKLSNDTSENRLLNAWSALENILRFYDSTSIIGKINEIIPKLIVMYSIKREMNNLWDKILPLINKNKIDIEELRKCKSVNNPRKYDKEKFALFLMNEKTGGILYEKTKSNVSINKSVIDLNGWLKNPKLLLEKIKFDEEAIRHNITTIYRLRNDLVHNGGIFDRNIENRIFTLRYYINCILGTLIHHIKRNPELTIEEILNSITLTYEKYIENIGNINKKIEDIDEEQEKCKNKNNDLRAKKEKAISEFGIENIAYVKYLYI